MTDRVSLPAWVVQAGTLALGLGSSCYLVLEPVCGDGLVNQAREQCDEGSANAPDAACTRRCTRAVCGDGDVWRRGLPEGMPYEACDDGKANAEDAACTPTCQRARCGDSVVWKTPTVDGESPEECDHGDGNNANNAACTAACRNARCGDGLVGPGETCDDGGKLGGDGCSPECRRPATLGLGTIGVKYIGEEPSDAAGSRVSAAGDVDNDGLDDLIIGAHGNDDGGTNAGAAYLVFGAAAQAIDLADAPVQLVGEEEEDHAGFSVSSAGDFNGDGFGDVIIGAYLNDAGGTDAGAAYVLFGPVTESATLADANLKLIGEGPEDWAGWSVAGAGDVDGDGYDDVLVGAPGSVGAAHAGVAYLVRGGAAERGPVLDLKDADAKLVGEVAGDRLGWSVAGAGDVDGDTYDDIVVGSLLNDEAGPDAGAAYVVSGPLRGVVSLAAAEAKILPEAAQLRVTSVSGAGDVDGDGMHDVLVGCVGGVENGESTGGVAYLMYGPLSGPLSLATADATFVGEDAASQAGHSVSGAGDVNGDGFDDLLVGAPWTDEPVDASVNQAVGAAYLIFGPVSGRHGLAIADVRFVGEYADDDAGRSVSAAGDVDGDGVPDLLVGAPGNDAGGTGPGAGDAAGAAYLLHGTTLRTMLR